MFNEQKAAQMAAFFLQQAGGRGNVLKLMKLLYLSDRESMNRYGEPITYDAMVAMKHGPVLSRVLECINGFQHSERGGWEDWVSDRENHNVSLKHTFERDDLDELSDADIEVMASVWQQFGSMNEWKLSQYTHDYCSEWQDPNDSAVPIAYRDVFIALGKNADVANDLQENIIASKQVSRLFASL